MFANPARRAALVLKSVKSKPRAPHWNYMHPKGQIENRRDAVLKVLEE